MRAGIGRLTIVGRHLVRMEATLGKSKRPTKPRAPNGEEKKNQLDLFLDWAVEAAKRTAAATAAARDAAAKHFEELKANFDRRSAKYCGILATLLGVCSYGESQSAATLIVAVATGLTAVLTAVPLIVLRTPRFADRAIQASSHAVTILLIIGVVSVVSQKIGPWLSSVKSPPANAPQEVAKEKVESLPRDTAPDEKLLAEEARRTAAAQDEKEAARIADCIRKENATQAARRAYSRQERGFAKCRSEYENAITLKSLDTYCGKERLRLDTAGRALDAAVANLCSATAGTQKSR